MTADTKSDSATSPSLPRYARPNVLLVDVKPQAEVTLRAEGFNISSGSFGLPYEVPVSDKYLPVIPNGRLEYFAEQEIVVVDLVPHNVLDGPLGEKVTSTGTNDVWAKCNAGVIDPRPRAMQAVRQDAQRILDNGGLFVIFADQRRSPDQFIGRTRAYSWPEKVSDYPYDNWAFLPILDYLRVEPDEGRDISVPPDRSHPLRRVVASHVKNAEFLCTLGPKPTIDKQWGVLANNRFGEPVAGVVVSSKGGGAALIMPQIEDKPRFLVELLKNAAPEFAPQLFPHAEGSRWVRRPEYEIPEIRVIKADIDRIEEEARLEVSRLEEIIENKRDEASYMHDLIGGTDQPLVLAVKRTLEVMGFLHVVDVDEEMEKAGDKGPRREDLQIHEVSPTLLVEIKGISSMPSDEDALTVSKYVAPRMREWDRTDVRGLSIINHQRHVPGLDRINENAFREDVVISAEEQKIGLLTAWDLFRMLRSYLKNDWRHEHVRSLFYKNGRISPVPEHYEFVGLVERFIERLGVVGVKIETGKLEQGDRIAFELPVEFHEQSIESLQIDGVQVDEAGIGALAGMKTNLNKAQGRLGTRVYRVIAS